MSDYLKATGRDEVAKMADKIKEHLRPDADVYADPKNYYDQLLELDLKYTGTLFEWPFHS
jgi:aconitate hydratase